MVLVMNTPLDDFCCRFIVFGCRETTTRNTSVTQANFILEQISIISTLPYGGCKAYLIGQVGQVRNNVIISEDT